MPPNVTLNIGINLAINIINIPNSVRAKSNLTAKNITGTVKLKVKVRLKNQSIFVFWLVLNY